MAEGVRTHAHHWCERAAPQARHFFDCEIAPRVRVLTWTNLKVAMQGFLHPLGPGDMACCAAAHSHDILSNRLVPAHIVEGRDARYRGGPNFGRLADAQ